jgi:hypothetical protein
MRWLKRIYNSRLFEAIANNFDPYSQYIERFLAIEKLKYKEENNKENENEPLGKN